MDGGGGGGPDPWETRPPPPPPDSWIIRVLLLNEYAFLHSIWNTHTPTSFFTSVYLFYYFCALYTLSGRPGGYPDDDLIKLKKKKKFKFQLKCMGGLIFFGLKYLFTLFYFCSKFDLYSKSDTMPDMKALMPYYEGLIKKYIPKEKLQW